MPRKPLKPCKYPGCPELTSDRFCKKHTKQHQRVSANDRGYNHRWRQARIKYFKEHPLCVRCEAQKKLTKATVVDHIQPHRGDETLFWDERNWQSLCKTCHDKKTMTEDRYVEYKYF